MVNFLLSAFACSYLLDDLGAEPRAVGSPQGVAVQSIHRRATQFLDEPEVVLALLGLVITADAEGPVNWPAWPVTVQRHDRDGERDQGELGAVRRLCGNDWAAASVTTPLIPDLR